jgi:gamma-glutamylaminecyclotransferase
MDANGEDRTMATRVFVYGSLMSGYGNHARFLAGKPGVQRIGPEAETTFPFRMVSLGGFPGCLEDDGRGGATRVKGEVYEVDNATLRDLDRLEGHPHFYRRREVSLVGRPPAWMYVLADGRGCERNPPVPDGDWRAYHETPEGSLAASLAARGG